MSCGGKELSKITYEDLLISSKYFYTEGSDDSSLLFPDETKEENPGDSSCAGKGSANPQEGSKIQNSLNIDVAFEAACGDPNFLVKDYDFNPFRMALKNSALVQLVDTLCTSAKEHVAQIARLAQLSGSQTETVSRILLKLHDAASTVGFLALASAADSFHRTLAARNTADLAAMAASLSATLDQAEQEWAVARPAHYQGAAASARSSSGAAPTAACLDGPPSSPPPPSALPPLRATVVRRFLASRR